MGYRFCDTHKPDPANMVPLFEVTNNTIGIWSLPCFYFNVDKPIDWHDPKFHDHIGWPEPRHIDNICQMPWEIFRPIEPDTKYHYIDMDKAIKIHLLSDYETDGAVSVDISIVFDAVDESGETIDTSDIVTECWISESEDWVINLGFQPTLSSFAGKPKEFMFNAYITRMSELNTPLSKDLIVRGKLLVFPG